MSKALRDDPQLGMRIMGSVDEEAASFGVSLKQRTKLRGLSAQACARLRQSPDLAIAEYTGKARKVEARHGARAELERQATAALGASLIWQGQEEGNAVGGAGWTPPPVQLPEQSPSGGECSGSNECTEGLTCQNHRQVGAGRWTKGVCLPPPKRRRGSPGVLTAGGILLGLGATGVLIGASAGSGGLLVGATVGAVLGTIGIILLIIGLIMLAAGN